jgi:anti-sigma factor RsiW
MLDQNWRDADGHPLPELLFLALEGELPAEEARLLSEHLSGCWSCRRQTDTFQRGIFSFVDYRRDVLLEAVLAPPSARSAFHERLRQRAAETARAGVLQSVRPHWKRAAMRLPRPAGVAVAAAVVTLAVFVSPIRRPSWQPSF